MKNLFAFILLISSNVFSQNDYYFGYQDGFKYGCSCYDLPTKNVAYIQGTYQTGYTDGKIDGLKYATQKSTQQTQPEYNRNTPHNYNNQPLYNPDYEILVQVLAEKQRLLNERRSDIQNRINVIGQLINQVITKNGSLTDSQATYVNSFDTQVVSFSNWDFSIYQNYSNVVDYLNKVQAQVITWL